MSYTGIGSRSTPPEILSLMTRVATKLRMSGWSLRSGGAQGADAAFERGAGSAKEIFYAKDSQPWCFTEVAKHCHEYPLDKMKPYTQELLARNMMQVLGLRGDDPSKFVICWVPTTDATGKEAGGTRYACRCAAAHGIPIKNLYIPEVRAKVEDWLSQ